MKTRLLWTIWNAAGKGGDDQHSLWKEVANFSFMPQKDMQLYLGGLSFRVGGLSYSRNEDLLIVLLKSEAVDPSEYDRVLDVARRDGWVITAQPYGCVGPE
jgi:hypothetical protein